MSSAEVPGDEPIAAREPFDDGLQPERTALSWRRTGLALLAGSLAATRIVPEVLPTWTVLPAGFGIAVSVFVLVAAQLRYRSIHAALTASGSAEVPLHGGGLQAAVAGLTVAGGIGALIVALTAALG
jgi:putative membrane protein